MKTKNIFRMLLVAVVLLLGANNVKAEVLWEDSNGSSGTEKTVTIPYGTFNETMKGKTLRITYGLERYDWGPQYKVEMWTNQGVLIFSQSITDNGSSESSFDIELTNEVYSNINTSDATNVNGVIYGAWVYIHKVEIISSDSRTPVTLSFSNTWKDITVGDNGVDGLGLTTDPSGLSISYESSNESIATVGTDGKLTGIAPGIATITATFEGNETYRPESKSYYLVVKHAFNGTAEGDQLWSGSVYFGDWQTTYGSYAAISNTVASSIQQGDKLRCYGAVETLGTDQGGAQWQLQLCSSSDWSEICTKNHYTQIDDYRIRNNGYIDIDVTKDIYDKIQNGFYIQGHNLTLFRVTRIEVVNKADVTLSFGETTAVATVGTNYTKTATATSNGQTVNVAITYTSSNQSVATVSNTGEVTPLTEGTTTITASFGGDDNYNAATSVSYTLTVNAAPQNPEYITVNMGDYECRTYVTTTYIDFSQSVGIKGYYATGLNSDGTAVQFTKVTGIVPSGVPLLLQKISGAFEYKLRISDTENATAPSPNKLKAGSSSSFSWIWGSNIYVLTVHNNLLVFAEVNDRDKQAQVDAEHAYLDLNNSNAHARLTIIFDDNNNGATGIDAIESNEQGREVIYDLHGQRVQNPTKGVYIVNGKKKVIK